jgi:CheY-like chemotaxis protein
MLEDEAQAKGLVLKVEVDDLPWRLIGDQTRLKQALLNYIKNAVKFTDVGGVTIKVALLDESDAHAMLRFDVIDTGIGLTDEVRTRLFCAYEQADIMTARLYGGTGLGLAITRKLVELMDGEAGVSSQAGQGSDFWFTVRLRKDDKEAAQLKPADDQRADEMLKREFAGASVLLVEDNRVSREIAGTILRNVDAAVEMANDGVEAVECAKRGRFALILMDVQMPRLDGLQATRAIRQMDHLSDTPILAMTANAYLDDKVRCLEAGMDDVITKPFDPEVLYRVLLRWLRSKRSGR